jgi:hypothetical protein
MIRGNKNPKKRFFKMNKSPDIIVIPKEKAVFWLDGNGCWQNNGGRFRKKKIIDYFHRHIDRDEKGYFVIQDKGGIWEKVYFPYEDTALFVFDIREEKNKILLTLNTGREIALNPETLCIDNDRLYTVDGDELIRFAERAMIKISRLLTENKNGRLVISAGGRNCVIKEK